MQFRRALLAALLFGPLAVSEDALAGAPPPRGQRATPAPPSVPPQPDTRPGAPPTPPPSHHAAPGAPPPAPPPSHHAVPGAPPAPPPSHPAVPGAPPPAPTQPGPAAPPAGPAPDPRPEAPLAGSRPDTPAPARPETPTDAQPAPLPPDAAPDAGPAPAEPDTRPDAPRPDPAAPGQPASQPRDRPPGTGAPPRAEDLRDTFGLGRSAPAAGEAPDCRDGLALACARATDPLDAATPYALATWLPASYLRQLPVGDATHDAVASYALGAGRDEAGVVIGGASGLENRWTIDGAPADNLRTGAVDTRVPLRFLSGVMVQTGGFSARDRVGTGGTIDARLVRGTANHEVAVDLWTQASRTPSIRPIASGSYTVRRLTSTPGPAMSGSVVATGPVPALADRLGGTTWYAAGIAPSVSTLDLRWRASRLVDANGDGLPDGLPGDVAVEPIGDTRAHELDYRVPVMARLGLDRGPHHLELSLIGQTGRTTRFAGNATLAAAGVDRQVTTGDAIATWRGEWPDTRARLQLTWHRSTQHESAHDRRAADIPQLLTAYIPTTLADDPELAAACDDAAPGDPVKSIANCPVAFGFFASGGAGQLTNTTADRPTLSGEIAHRIGRHVVRAGATLEDSRLVTTTRFTGNEQDRSLFVGELSRLRFYRGTCSTDLTQPCSYATGSKLTYRTAYAAAYAEDTFSPIPGLTIDAGLRWELMWVGTALHFSRQLAPRLGAVWDPLGGGRSRLWASAGRTFAMLPAGLGTTVIGRDATAEEFEIGIGGSRVFDPGTAVRVVSGIESIQQDEATVGGEIALAGALRATVWGQARYLRHGLETTPDGFDNPGGQGEIAAMRETEIVAFQLELRRPAAAIRTGVLWGRTVGTWTGPFDPRLGANQLQGPDWNGDPTNLYGPLPTQFGGRFFAEVEHHRSIAGFELAAAARLSADTGRPRNVLANGNDGIVELLPRGSAGTGPVITQTDLRLAARQGRLSATLDIVNLFDRRTVTNLDEIYTDDTVRPIAGGRVRDLTFLRNELGAAAQRRTAFQLPTAYQAPLSVSFGLHAAF